MMRCLDCGGQRGPLCPACTEVAEALGHTRDERLTLLGAPPLIGAPDG